MISKEIEAKVKELDDFIKAKIETVYKEALHKLMSEGTLANDTYTLNVPCAGSIKRQGYEIDWTITYDLLDKK